MLIFILILILLLPVALLPLALGSFFESEELIDMGVYLVNAQHMPVSNKKRAAGSNISSTNLVTSPST